jgi:cytochrome c
MADSLMFNKIAGAALATGLLIFGLQNAVGIIFEREPPTKPGDAIVVQEETEGAAPADVPPDWGTVLPKADIAAGQATTSKCASCHQFDPGDTPNIGPGLYGVVGRAPGTQAKYTTYDQAMHDFSKTHAVWTYDELYKFLKAPGTDMPGTKMTFVGLPDPQDRINVIAFLRSNGSPNFPIPAPKPAAAPSTGGANPAGNGPATAPAAGAAKTPSTPVATGAPTNAASETAHTAPAG